ncbi:hypothetical protein BJX70DRAFT_275285 [Aspergillus crustosus]
MSLISISHSYVLFSSTSSLTLYLFAMSDIKHISLQPFLEAGVFVYIIITIIKYTFSYALNHRGK